MHCGSGWFRQQVYCSADGRGVGTSGVHSRTEVKKTKKLNENCGRYIIKSWRNNRVRCGGARLSQGNARARPTFHQRRAEQVFALARRLYKKYNILFFLNLFCTPEAVVISILLRGPPRLCSVPITRDCSYANYNIIIIIFDFKIGQSK